MSERSPSFPYGLVTDDERTYLNSPWTVPSEAAKYLRLSKSTLDRMRSEGTGPRFYRRNGVVLYHRDDLDAWMRGGEMTVGPNRGPGRPKKN